MTHTYEAEKAMSAATAAICERAIELAAGADPSQIVQIADAVAKLAYGPQGGVSQESTSTSTTYRYHASYDGQRPRAAGFTMVPEAPT